MLGDRRDCYPLTVTDLASRYLLTCEALSTTQDKFAFTVFERTFEEFGLPLKIRTDNGVPFASAHPLYGLSTLAVWWLRLGIEIERTQRRALMPWTFTVTQCGRICFKGRKVNLSHVFAGQNVGVTQVGERVWLVTFMRYDLGYFDDETCRSKPSRIRSRRNCYPCLRNKLLPMSPEQTRRSWLLRLDSNQQPSG
jgi:hypothetical protein